MITNDSLSLVTKIGQKDVFSIKKSNNSHKLVGNGEKNFNTDHCTTNTGHLICPLFIFDKRKKKKTHEHNGCSSLLPNIHRVIFLYIIYYSYVLFPLFYVIFFATEWKLNMRVIFTFTFMFFFVS